MSENPEKTFEQVAREFEEWLENVDKKPPRISAAEHNRRMRAKLAQERMVEQQRQIPAARLQEMMDQAQEAYLDRLREREIEDRQSCHRGSGDPDWRA
jgi:hypothetical protein